MNFYFDFFLISQFLGMMMSFQLAIHFWLTFALVAATKCNIHKKVISLEITVGGNSNSLSHKVWIYRLFLGSEFQLAGRKKVFVYFCKFYCQSGSFSIPSENFKLLQSTSIYIYIYIFVKCYYINILCSPMSHKFISFNFDEFIF